MPNPETKYPSLTGDQPMEPGRPVHLLGSRPRRTCIAGEVARRGRRRRVRPRRSTTLPTAWSCTRAATASTRARVGDTPAQRAYFNFLLLGGIERAPEVEITEHRRRRSCSRAAPCPRGEHRHRQGQRPVHVHDGEQVRQRRERRLVQHDDRHDQRRHHQLDLDRPRRHRQHELPGPRRRHGRLRPPGVRLRSRPSSCRWPTSGSRRPARPPRSPPARTSPTPSRSPTSARRLRKALWSPTHCPPGSPTCRRSPSPANVTGQVVTWNLGTIAEGRLRHSDRHGEGQHRWHHGAEHGCGVGHHPRPEHDEQHRLRQHPGDQLGHLDHQGRPGPRSCPPRAGRSPTSSSCATWATTRCRTSW